MMLIMYLPSVCVSSLSSQCPKSKITVTCLSTNKREPIPYRLWIVWNLPWRSCTQSIFWLRTCLLAMNGEQASKQVRTHQMICAKCCRKIIDKWFLTVYSRLMPQYLTWPILNFNFFFSFYFFDWFISRHWFHAEQSIKLYLYYICTYLNIDHHLLWSMYSVLLVRMYSLKFDHWTDDISTIKTRVEWKENISVFCINEQRTKVWPIKLENQKRPKKNGEERREIKPIIIFMP